MNKAIHLTKIDRGSETGDVHFSITTPVPLRTRSHMFPQPSVEIGTCGFAFYLNLGLS